MNPPASDTIAPPPRHRRRRLVLSGLALLAAVAGSLLAGGRFAPKIIYGRSWPASQRLSLDDVSHDDWDALLRRYVDESGAVDYAGWKGAAADVHALDEYLALLSRGDPQQHATREAQLAFWINAYNALTIRGILREYPTASIQQHAALLWGFNIWRDLLLHVGDSDYSLGWIEHELLRPLHEPRIHFAIVCASRGCPRLLNRAYTAAELEARLDWNSRAFFADSQKLAYDASTSRLRLSPILKWYAADFGPDQAAMLTAIAPYLPADVSRQLQSGGTVRVDYLDYDWSLNEQAPGSDEAPAPPAESGNSEGPL